MRRKLKRFAAEEGLAQTARAIDYAYDAHAGQVRKPSVFSDAQVPYIFHPFVMACHAHALGIRDDAVLACASPSRLFHLASENQEPDDDQKGYGCRCHQ